MGMPKIVPILYVSQLALESEGIFVDGKLLHGHRFRGGEFGFMITQANGEMSVIYGTPQVQLPP
ncbi:ROK family protein [[Brevibacterium] frigoritolerans]|uniref:ROK family protein n=1 Tax=Peribacillus frigoritolerans TaxID=450367 RepID=A0A941FJT8_9BACI|nr:ROK family protein [Peribacillus frigoritolerans]